MEIFNDEIMTKKWSLYQRTHTLRKKGYNILNISLILGISRDTVYKYLEMDENEFIDFLIGLKSKKKKLDKYKKEILGLINKSKGKSKKEVYRNFQKKHNLDVTYKTFLNFVKKIIEVEK